MIDLNGERGRGRFEFGVHFNFLVEDSLFQVHGFARSIVSQSVDQGLSANQPPGSSSDYLKKEKRTKKKKKRKALCAPPIRWRGGLEGRRAALSWAILMHIKFENPWHLVSV